MKEEAQSVEQGHDPRVSETKGGGSLTILHGRSLKSVESVLAQDAILTDPLRLEKFVHLDLVGVRDFSAPCLP